MLKTSEVKLDAAREHEFKEALRSYLGETCPDVVPTDQELSEFTAVFAQTALQRIGELATAKGLPPAEKIFSLVVPRAIAAINENAERIRNADASPRAAEDESASLKLAAAYIIDEAVDTGLAEGAGISTSSTSVVAGGSLSKEEISSAGLNESFPPDLAPFRIEDTAS